MRTAILGLALVGIIGVIAIQHQGHAEEHGSEHVEQEITSREFTLSADPTVKVLQIVYRDAQSYRETSLTLYGDGRFVAIDGSRNGDIYRQGETEFSFEETRAIVEIAVSHGLADATASDVIQRVKATLPPGEAGVSPPDDAGTTTVALHFEEYIRNGERLGPFSSQLSLEAHKILHIIAPSVPEPAGFVKLSERLLPVHARLLREGKE